jgi:hypothetical protein
MRYRVVEIQENVFIPQVKKSIFSSWNGIQKNGCDVWFGKHYQLRYCSTSTLEEAKQIAQTHKERKDKNKQYPKYFKL